MDEQTARSGDDFALLVIRARRGDAAALTALIRQYEPELRIVARVRLGASLRPYLDSMDLVQSVHYSLLRGLRQNRFDIACADEMLALAVTLLQRKIARHWRRHRRQQRLDGQTPGAGPVQDWLAGRDDGRNDPARLAQLHDEIHHICRDLNVTDRRLIELRLQDLKTAEAARQLGEKPNSCRARLKRLRERLQHKGGLADGG